jgi:hypothetical protein
MKIGRGCAISLGLNVLMLALVLTRWHMPVPNGVQTSIPASTPAQTTPTITEAKTPVTLGTGWQSWIESLRRAKVPPEVIADLVKADFDRRWQTRQAQLQQKYIRGEADADTLALLDLEHESQQETELRQALGENDFRHLYMVRVLQSLHIDQVQLSDSERNAVYELESGLRDELRTAQGEKLRGTIDQATLNARQQAVQETVAQKLRTLLGEQRATLLLGVDATQGELNRSLRDASLSEVQRNALVQLQRSWDQTRSDFAQAQTATGDPSYANALEHAEEKWRRDFQQIAGTNVFDQFLKTQDSRYTALRRYADAWRISPRELEEVFTTLADFDRSSREYEHDATARGVDPSIQRETNRQFERETAQLLQQRLGATRFAVLKQNGIVPSDDP